MPSRAANVQRVPDVQTLVTVLAFSYTFRRISVGVTGLGVASSLPVAPLAVVVAVALSPFTTVAVETTEEVRKLDVGKPRVGPRGTKPNDGSNDNVSAAPKRSSLVCVMPDCLILVSVYSGRIFSFSLSF